MLGLTDPQAQSQRQLSEGARRVLVFTALPVEYRAVWKRLEDVKSERHPQGTIYEHGHCNVGGDDWDVWLAETGRGNERAAMEVERGIAHVKPELVVFIGVAGGIKDVRLGDVVIAEKVYNYEVGKTIEVQLQPRPDVFVTDYPILQIARAMARRRRSAGRGSYSVQVGAIAAGEQVVASRRAETLAFVREHYGDALVLDMESHGLMLSAYGNAVPALVIRGVSDQLVDKADADSAGYQKRASENATRVFFEILQAYERRALLPRIWGHRSPGMSFRTL